MALNCNVAFGRYLRTLRERRPLSLDEVESLSRSFPDPINKGYLSRCENGRQFPSLSKTVALSRIYEVPTDVLVERMELDMELDRLGGPETEGKTFAELYEQGRDCLDHGAVWDSYGLTRDASFVAHSDEVIDNFRDRKEQVLWACMNVATVAAKLGRFRFARHEYEYVDKTNVKSPKLSVMVPERLSHIYRELGLYDRARTLSEQAIAEAERRNLSDYLGHAYFTRARLAEEEGDSTLASEYYQRAFRVDKSRGADRACAIDLLNLAQSYLNLSRLPAARLAIEAALRLSRRLESRRTEGFALVLLGEIEEAEHRPKHALAHWRKAVGVARELNDRLLRFKAEVRLYRRALQDGTESAARAMERRLRKLAPWIPEEAAEITEFKRLIAHDPERFPRRVAVSQPPIGSVDNDHTLPTLPLPPKTK